MGVVYSSNKFAATTRIMCKYIMSIKNEKRRACESVLLLFFSISLVSKIDDFKLIAPIQCVLYILSKPSIFIQFKQDQLLHRNDKMYKYSFQSRSIQPSIIYIYPIVVVTSSSVHCSILIFPYYVRNFYFSCHRRKSPWMESQSQSQWNVTIQRSTVSKTQPVLATHIIPQGTQLHTEWEEEKDTYSKLHSCSYYLKGFYSKDFHSVLPGFSCFIHIRRWLFNSVHDIEKSFVILLCNVGSKSNQLRPSTGS